MSMAVGSGNDVIHILFTPGWKLLTELNHIRLTRLDNADHYEEETPGKFIPDKFPLKYMYFDAAVSGINRIKWAKSGKFIASSTASHVRSVFIWDVEYLTLIEIFTFLGETEISQLPPARTSS
jgi:WD40 repeat protein